MWIRMAVAVATIMTSPGTVLAQSPRCESSPLLDDTMSKEERAKALMERGGICVREGKPLESIAVFSELIGLRPNDTIAYLNRGNAYLQSGQFELGIADISHVISLSPNMAEGWYNRGVGFIAGRQFVRAIDDLTEAVRLRPGFARAYCSRAFARLRLSDYDAALADALTGIEQDRALPFCRFVSGEVYFARADYSKAVTEFSAGLALQKNLQALIKRGEAFEHLGDRKSALADFQSALAAAPQSKEARDGKSRLQALPIPPSAE